MSFAERPSNPRAVPGDNQPPGPIEDARATYKRVADFLKDHPVIQDEDTARKINDIIAIGTTSLKAIEKARDDEATPLRKAWEEARAKYAPALDGLTKILRNATDRLQDFMREEKRKRDLAAAEAKRIADEAERLAREKEAEEQAAIENAKEGEFTDVGAKVEEANEAFDDYAAKARAAKIAEKDAHVGFKSRFGNRKTSLRTQEVLYVDDPLAAVKAMWPDEKLAEAIKTAARAYRKEKGELPTGVRAEKEDVL